MNQKQIFNFLGELSQNNHKEWMDGNRSRYLEAKRNFEELIGVLLAGLVKIEPELGGITPKNCIFRINRDIRFSKDKSPYKNNFGAFISEDGKKSLSPGYYLHMQPGESFLAGGMYMPPGDQLKKIRQEIDYDYAGLKEIVEAPEFISFFDKLQGEKLKKAPQGYPVDHPNIEALKLKSYIVMHRLKDETLLQTDFPDYAIKVFEALKPLNDWLKVAVS